MTSPDNKLAELDAFLKSTTVPSRDDHEQQADGQDSTSTPAPLQWPDPVASEDEQNVKAFWRSLRTFYRTAEGGNLLDDEGHPVLYPALLAPFRDMRRVRHDYPVWLADPDGPFEASRMEPLPELLNRAVGAFAPAPSDARILKENLARLELIVRTSMPAGASSTPFSELMTASLQELESQLAIQGPEGAGFSEDVAKLRRNLPSSGRLVAFSEKTAALLLAAAIREECGRRGGELMKEAERLRGKLNELLRIEHEKDPASRAPATLKSSYGYGASYIDFDKFSNVLPDTANEAMPPDRLRRIENIVKTLERAGSFWSDDAVMVMADELTQTLIGPNDVPSVRLLPASKGRVCATARQTFDEHMRFLSELVAAVRMAHLEVEGRYDPDVHDGYFSRFDWQSFSDEEMASCPPVILVVPVEDVMGRELVDFSRMLSSHRPIKVMVIKRDAGFEYRVDSAAETGLRFSFQQELGALAVSHRNTFVLQSSGIHPRALFEGLSRGLVRNGPALFYVLSPNDRPELPSYVWAGACLESRAFPEFSYDRQQGEQWGSRFNVESNPYAELEWPVYEMNYEVPDGPSSVPVPFTFADFAALDPHFTGQFLPVPRPFWSDDLVLFSEYLKMPPGEAYSKIPFIWMVDSHRVLHKVATTHFLVLFAQERLDFWHFIQDLGGINSYHAERAIEKVRKEFAEEKERESAATAEVHAREMERVRETTARDALERLSAVLLDLDLIEALPAERAIKRTESVPTTETPEPIPAEFAVQAEEEILVTTEAWIETLRCTSCNECTNLNPNCFKYDANKQAYLADVHAASFAQLVMAAEKCPAKCIHPGAPLNPNEPGLEELTKRAAPFNG